VAVKSTRRADDELARLALVALGANGGSMTHQALEAWIRPDDPEALFWELRELVRDGVLWFEGVAGPGRVWYLLPHCDTRKGLHRALPGLDAEAVRGIARLLDSHAVMCAACRDLPQALSWRAGRVPA
jgi:hypothetical protein